jgi:hypothetical protein
MSDAREPPRKRGIPQYRSMGHVVDAAATRLIAEALTVLTIS